jgi:myosin heavy subunit
VTAAMQQWAISYQQQEEYFQQTLLETKEQYEDMIRTKLQEITNQHQKEVSNLNEKLTERDSREKEYQSQISELEMEKQTISERKEQLELINDELSQKMEDNQQKVSILEKQIDELKEELEEEKTKEPETSGLQLRDIQLARAQSKADWLEQCLSYSNFAPLTILIRMGNKMTLDALAKSVGMDPIVLDNQLKLLHNRDLIDIRNDGMIVANIPTLEKTIDNQ